MDRRTYIKRSGLWIGGVFFSSGIVMTMQACGDKKQRKNEKSLFTDDQRMLIAEVAEVIIPASDTPGAKDIEVEHRIEVALAANYEEEEQRQPHRVC